MALKCPAAASCAVSASIFANQRTAMSTSITILANGYMEIICIDPWLEPLKRHYIIRRTVDYASICLQ
jgi:hypothetical protein